MKKLRFLLLLCFVLANVYAFGQRIKSAEYFIDVDPGINKGQAITFTNNLDSINMNDSLTTTGFGLGFHNLFLRVKDSLGNWSLYEGRSFLVDNYLPSGATFKNPKAEYFFDNDPGIGKGKQISYSLTADSIVVSDSFPTTGLKQGFHGLFLRVQNSLGIWSLYEGRNFLIDSVSNVGVTFKNPNAEYFFDYDPGIGKAKPISITATADSFVVNNDSIVTTGLKSGFHGLFLRVQNSIGKWSLYEGRNFLIDSASSVGVTFKNPKAEYFFDYDPGIGKGKQISYALTSDSILVNDSFPTTGLKSGFHALFIRVQNSIGKWSLYEGRNFLIDTGLAIKPVTNYIVSAEYYYDSDPGVGKGTNIPTSFTPFDSVKVSSSLSISSLSSGTHYLFIRAKDKTNTWSLVASAKFYICPTAFPAPVITGKTSYCAGDSIKLSISSISGAANYFWKGPNGFTATTLSMYVANADTTKSSGVYSIYATRSGSGTACDTSPVAYDTIIVNPRPIANAGLSQTICNGGITTIGSTALSVLTYSWVSNPAGFSSTLANPSVSPTLTTTFTVTETNKAGCGGTASNTVTVNPLPNANAGTYSTICSGVGISIGAATVSGSKYSWVSRPTGFTSTISNPTVSPTIATTYLLTETSASGCSKTDSITISINPLPTPNAGASQAICNSGSVTIGASSATGYNYSWISNPTGFTSSISNPNISPTVTTTYTLTETTISTGCSNSASVTIYVNPQPSANTGSTQTICSGDSAIIGATAVSGDSYSWVSSTPGFNSALSSPYVKPTSTTTYTLTETVGTCSKTNSVVVTVNPLPTPVAGFSQTICSGSTISIGSSSVSGHSYNWKSNPSGFTSNVSNPNINPNVTTVYDLIETINTTGCHKTDSVTINVNPTPTVNVGTPATICSGSSVTIGSASIAGNSYSWASNPTGFTSVAANPTVSPTATTSYILTETNASNCSNSNSVTITVNPIPAALVIPNTSICSGKSISIGGSAVAGNSYSWVSSPTGFGSTAANPGVTPTVNTTYTLTETNAGGCNKTNSVSITVNPLPDAHWTLNYFGITTYLHADDSTHVDTSYHWAFGDSSIASGHLAKHIFPKNKSYGIILLVTGTDGCINYFDSTVNITVSGIDPIGEDIDKLLIYPNPFQSSVIIQYDLLRTSDVQIAVYDLAGKEVAKIAMLNQDPGQKELQIDADKYNFMPGVYLLKLITAQGIITKQIVKL